MKALAARAARYRNRLEGRSGTLWESRYKSSIVQTDAYLLACARYIELNPVRARVVAEPADYLWSSYRDRMGLTEYVDWLDVFSSGRYLMERRERYEGVVKRVVSPGEVSLIREAPQRGQLTGSARFLDEVEQITGIRIEQRGRGRPKAQTNA